MNEAAWLEYSHKECSLLILGVWELPVAPCQALEWESPLKDNRQDMQGVTQRARKSVF